MLVLGIRCGYTFPKLPFPNTTSRVKSSRVKMGSDLDPGTISDPLRRAGMDVGSSPPDPFFFRFASVPCLNSCTNCA